jgi:predicted acyl esterase
LRPLTLALVLATLLLVPAAGASAAAPDPFGHPCTAENGIRFCPATTLAQRVPSWDGTPIDIDVSLPPTGNGPFPTIVMLHGVGSTKTMFESTTPEGSGPIFWHANNDYYAQQGYAVVNYSMRGWGNSCGTILSRALTPACDKGWIHLDDERFDTRDLQYLVGLLVDQGVSKPSAIGVTGISLGGGGTVNAAFANGSVRQPDGSFKPWRSPHGTPLKIAAAWPRWQWSDLADSLVPNGRFLDDQTSTIGLGATPPGLMKQSFVTGLYATSLLDAYVSPPGVDPSADLVDWYRKLNKGEPYGASIKAIEAQLRTYHSAVGLYGRKAAPLLVNDGFTDDLFPAPQGLRTYNQLTQRSPRSTVQLQLGDLGHGRAQNKTLVNHTFADQATTFFAHYLQGQGSTPTSGKVTVVPQTCPSTAPDGTPITAATWAAIHPGTFTVAQPPVVHHHHHHRHPAFTGSVAQPPQRITSTGGIDATATALNIPQNLGQTCQKFPTTKASGTAVYTRKVTNGFTMVGSPEITATFDATGAYPQVDARLWDVAPGGTQTIVSRAPYRVSGGSPQKIDFQLWGNAYTFAAGHTVKVELLGQDASAGNTLSPVPTTPAQVAQEAGKILAMFGNFVRPSNGTFSATLSNVTITLPTHERRPG